MPSIDPGGEQLKALAALDPERPITMINLLRFREQADYPADFDAEPCSGEEAYERYGEYAVAALTKVGGRPIWAGAAHQVVIGPADESWDEAILVHYPSLAAFQQMIMDPAYQAIVPHRTAALSDSRLILCDTSEQPPGVVGG